jgi:hypothetical protein
MMPYEPLNPHERRYAAAFRPAPALEERSRRHCMTIMESMIYDCNTVEFAVRGGIPYAIDYVNGAPDAELNSVGQANFDWFVEHMATF